MLLEMHWWDAVGVLGFIFSVVVFFLESRTRQRLASASNDLNKARIDFEEQQADLQQSQARLEATEKTLEARLSHLEKMSSYAAGATSLNR